MKNFTEYKENILKKYEKYFTDLRNTDSEISPTVSVIVPCYNVEKYIEECLASLVKQTFKNIEIICINDGSSDLTLQILNAFSESDKRITVINQENKGVSVAKNRGLEIAKGDFITFLDSDDWLDNDYIEKMYNAITANSCDIAVSGMIRKRPNSQKYRLHYENEKVYFNLQEKINILRIPICCYICGKLFKKELIKDSLLKAGVYFEDVLWIPEIIKKAKGLVTVPDTYYYYRVNNCSIVKGKQTDKKLLDSYKAHKYIIEFFKTNNLSISKKYEHVTRKIIYFCNIPLVKIKEYQNKQLFYFLGFLPFPAKLFVFFKELFSISDIDGHKMIYILGIQIRKKYKTTPIEITIKENGITKNNRNPKIILSLTTFPDRINTVSKTIKTLLNQTLKPDKVILWLAESQFPKKENELPQELLNLQKFGLTIDWCEDIRSYKKLIPAIEKYPNDIIITFDDDIYYDNDVVENLYNSYLKHPKCIHANRGTRVDIVNEQIKPKKNADIYWIRYLTPSFKNTIIGCGGVLYPPNCLHKTATDRNLFQKVIPTQDDLWFWAMALLNKTKIQIVSSYDMQIKTVENTQHCGLCKINNSSNKGINGKDGFKIISKTFPEILDIIKGECND